MSDRPDFSIGGQLLQGNSVTAGDQLTMSAPEGDIYYTLDGSDPWSDLPSVQYTALIAESAAARVLVPNDGSLRSDWQSTDFDDSNWMSGTTGIGFDTNDELTSLIGLNIQEQMKDINATAYVRVPFQVEDPSQFDTLELSMRYDDGFVAYLNGVEVARRNASSASFNSRASQPHANVEAIEFEKFNLSRERHLLKQGENVLAIHGLNSDPPNVDFLITPLLQAGKVVDAGISPTAIRFTEPVTVPNNTSLKARTLWGDQWSTLHQATTATSRSPLRVVEVMYHPSGPTSTESTAGITDADDFEFIELQNTSDRTISLSDVRLVQAAVAEDTEGVEFDFANGSIVELGPDSRLLVVEDLEAFRLRYGDNLPVAGQWTGGLNNASEMITLMSGEIVVQQFTYDDEWYAQTDGQGASLEVIDVSNTPDDQYGNPQRWQPSQVNGGTPGVASDVRIAGDANSDGQFNQDDLDQVAASSKYMSGQPATYAEGDWNGDGVFDQLDIVHALVLDAFQQFGDLPLSAHSPRANPFGKNDPSSRDATEIELADEAIIQLMHRV